MMKHHSRVNENFEELIQSLTSRLDTLQSQYINFASFCSNIINTHTSTLKKELNNQTVKSIQAGVSKSIEILQSSYQKATNELGLSVASKNVQDALDRTQKQIISLTRQNLTQLEYEKTVSAMFIQVSEIVARKILRTRSKSKRGMDERRMKKINEQYVMKETMEYREKIEGLERRVNQLVAEKESRERELMNLTQSIESKAGVQTLSVDLRGFDGSKTNSMLGSPVSSPILGERRRQIHPNPKNSPDKSLDIEKFRQKLGGLASLLEKFNFFTLKLDETIGKNPELSEVVQNFKSAKTELAFALMDIIGPRPASKKSVEERPSDTVKNNEIYILKSENCKLKAELNHKAAEILDFSDQSRRLENEIKELRKNFLVCQEDTLKLEKEREEFKLESIYLKSIIGKLERHNKVLQDSIMNQEKKTNDFILLQSKYDEIIKDLKLKPRSLLKVEFVAAVWVGPKRRVLLKVEFQSDLSVESKINRSKYSRFSPTVFEDKQSIETIYQLNKKITMMIGEKTKLEEELLEIKGKLRNTDEENQNLTVKFNEALEMCKIFEEILNKSHNAPKDHQNNVHFIGTLTYFPQKSTKPPISPTKIPKLDLKPDKKLEEKISYLENSLKSKTEEIDSILKTQENTLQDSIKIKEELSEAKKSITNLLKANSILEEKLKTQPEPKSERLSIIKTSNFSKLIPIFNTHSSFLTNTQQALSNTIESYSLKIKSLKSSSQSIKKLISQKSKQIQDLKIEVKSLNSEKNKLLETRDKLIVQCNTQSEELISLKLEQEESVSHRKDDHDYEIQLLKNQVKQFQLSESNLIQALTETTEKYTNLVQSANEKDTKIETLTSELSQLKFKQSVKSLDSSDKYKEEVYSLKMKNIKLEQAVEDLKNSELSLEEINQVKSVYNAQINKIDEERVMLERKLKESEVNWSKEKDSLKKSLDSFTKQLAGANLEIHNLRTKINELESKIEPKFESSDEYKIHRVVEHEKTSWYLLEILNTHQFLWTSLLQFENTDEIKDPLPNLLKERGSLQKLNSELCMQSNKLKIVLNKVESLAKKENLLNVLGLIQEGKNEKSDLDEVRREEVKRNRLGRGGSRIGRPLDVRTVSEMSDKNSVESRRSNQSNKSTTFKMILQDKDEELGKKNDCIRKQEIGIIRLKEENHRLRENQEKFQHLKLLINKFQLLNPKLNSDCSLILKTMLALAEPIVR